MRRVPLLIARLFAEEEVIEKWSTSFMPLERVRININCYLNQIELK